MLKVKNLSAYYGLIKAVKEINFRVKDGQIVSLIGSNGAGKTSTLSSIVSDVKKTGEIIYDGINGKNIDKWVKNTSFTSNKKSANWIQISGYFIDKKWTKAKKQMWVKKAQVIKK